MLPAHIYMHVPFCAAKCQYCDFFSVTTGTDDLLDAVSRRLVDDISRLSKSGLPGQVRSLYIGGGTPMMLGARLFDILAHAKQTLLFTADAEITVEANPDSMRFHSTEALAMAGVTRVSLGAQSFDAATLATLGRSHSPDDVSSASREVVEARLDLSIDLICGVPGMSDEAWGESLSYALATGASHISVYPLAIEPGTRMFEAMRAGTQPLPDPDGAADQMILAENTLETEGLSRYEVANYAKRGKESIHNLAYWQGRSYLGLGPSAHGMLDLPTAAALGLAESDVSAEFPRVRYAQPADIGAWLAGSEPTLELLDADQVQREDLMLALRLTEPIDVKRFKICGMTGVLESLLRDGLVEHDGSAVERSVRVTKKGWLLGNEVYSRVWMGVKD